MLAPILSFTADEAWEFVPGKSGESVHQTTWQPLKFTRPETEEAAWAKLFELRELSLPALEQARQAKQIGKALEAKLTFSGAAGSLEQAQAHAETLRELLNVSQLSFTPTGDGPITVSVSKAEGQKCERCWHWETDIGSATEHPTLCGRCVRAVTS